MTKHVHIDFETRSAVDLRTCGTWNYIADPSASIICCAYAIDNGEPKIITGKEYPVYEGLQKGSLSELIDLANDPTVLFFAHNATFEIRVWEHQLIKYGVPVVPLDRWHCTMAMAYMFNLPGSLAGASMALGISESKDRRGKLLIGQLCCPRKAPKKNEYVWDDTPSTFQELYDYCLQDVRVEQEKNEYVWDNTPSKFQEMYDYCLQDVRVEQALTKKLPMLVPFERSIWLMDKVMNSGGMQIDLDLINAAEEIFETHKERLKPKFRELTGCNPTQGAKIIEWLMKHGVPREDLSKMSFEDGEKVEKLSVGKDILDLLLENPEITGDVRTVLEIRKEFSKSSIAKFQAFRELADDTGVLRDYLIYGRAVTMRWGGNGAQPQNLPSRGCAKNQDLLIHLIKNRDYDTLSVCYPKISQALSSAIRGVIVSRPGHDLMVTDYSAIEARVLMWLAGETDVCRKFLAGADLYVEMAKVIYNDPTITKAKNPAEREVAKQAVLGCGFGMGPQKFQDTCAKFGIDVDMDLAKKAVYAYRGTYSKVKNLWYEVNDMAIFAVENPGSKVYVHGSDSRIFYIRNGSYLYLVLPSKRPVVYPFPEVRMIRKDFGDGPVDQRSLTYMKEDSMQNNKWVRVDTYGGKLIENAVQSIARDIMAIGGLNCGEAGYNLRLLVHDEAIVEVPEGFGSVVEFEKLMTNMPPWAEGCPVQVSGGWRGKRYKKG